MGEEVTRTVTPPVVWSRYVGTTLRQGRAQQCRQTLSAVKPQLTRPS